MALFAKVNTENVVENVIVAEQADVNGMDGTWIEYSEDGSVRNFCIPGYTYDAVRDKFLPPQPYASWVLDEDDLVWVPPINFPEDTTVATWDEDAYQADTNDPKTAGWVTS